MNSVNRDEAYGMIPVGREPGPWSKYLRRELERVVGGYRCEKCGKVFPTVIKLVHHDCLKDHLTLTRERGEAE